MARVTEDLLELLEGLELPEIARDARRLSASVRDVANGLADEEERLVLKLEPLEPEVPA